MKKSYTLPELASSISWRSSLGWEWTKRYSFDASFAMLLFSRTTADLHLSRVRPVHFEQNPQSARRNNFQGEQIPRWFLLLSENLSASNYPGAAFAPGLTACWSPASAGLRAPYTTPLSSLETTAVRVRRWRPRLCS